MSFLTVGGNVIPCAVAGGGTIKIEETGGRERMFDASLLETVRARKQVIALVTKLASRAQTELYRGYLLASPPVACNGELFNSVATNCMAQVTELVPENTVSGVKWSLRFTLWEA